MTAMIATLGVFQQVHPVVPGIEIGIEADRDKGWHVERIAQGFVPALNESPTSPSI